MKKATEKKGAEETAKAKSSTASNEVYAAIAMAISMYQSQDNGEHDVESCVLTFKNDQRYYSPWSSKIHTLRQTPTVNKK